MDIGLPDARRYARRSTSIQFKPIEAFRILEIVLTICAIIALLPLLALTVILVRIDSPGPVLFRHQRIGRNGITFGCMKFRTMVVDAEARLASVLSADPVARSEWDLTRKLSRDPRITPLGKFLRKSSLDELPQLFNVLAGDMSLVGPRPIVIDELHHYGRHIEIYYRVRPGISGMWQISGRSDTSYRRRVACDILYVRRKCFRLDCAIAICTIPVILGSRGAR